MRRKHNKSCYVTVVGCHQSAMTMCKYMSWNTKFPLSFRKTFSILKFFLKAMATIFSDKEQKMQSKTTTLQMLQPH